MLSGNDDIVMRMGDYIEQLDDSIEFCKESDLLYKKVTADCSAAARKKAKELTAVCGLVFIHKTQIPALIHDSFLVLMDSTHDTNRLRWYLFTLLVRDRYGSWRPGGHFLTQTQHSPIIQACLTAITELIPSFNPAYMVNDDSAAEQKSYRCFDNLSSRPSSLLCQYHWFQAIKRGLPGKPLRPVREQVRKALYFAVDKADCEVYCQKVSSHMSTSFRAIY